MRASALMLAAALCGHAAGSEKPDRGRELTHLTCAALPVATLLVGLSSLSLVVSLHALLTH